MMTHASSSSEQAPVIDPSLLQLFKLSLQETDLPLRGGKRNRKKKIQEVQQPAPPDPPESSKTPKRKKGKKPPKIIQQFAEYFGEETKLENWQRLCEDLGIDPVPRSLTQCKKALKGCWINIVDFIANQKDGTPQHFFKTEQELARYTMRTPGKIYPKDAAKEGGPIRLLLAHVFRGGNEE